MNLLFLTFYNFFLCVYYLLIKVGSLSNNKARKWIKGRISDKIKIAQCSNEKKIWFHASSLGEFEQGRPLIEKIKTEKPEIKIVLTFFSPSGYEIRKNYEYADYIFYLPLDGKNRSKKFIEAINPSLAIFIKYDFWYYYFSHLKQMSVPLLIISANIREENFNKKFYNKLYLKMLSLADYIFTQNLKSEELLELKGFENISTAGDTRIDRVLAISSSIHSFRDEKIENFCQNSNILIAGSSYSFEENLIKKCIDRQNHSLKFLIVPHEVKVKRLNEIIRIFNEDMVLWSKCNANDDFTRKKVMVIDTVGLLNKIYKYGNIALIGGGFNNSIHNLLEPAACKLPVIFGPNNSNKFQEAAALIELQAGFLIKNESDFFKTLDLLLLNNKYIESGIKAYDYLTINQGATETIYNYINTNYFNRN